MATLVMRTESRDEHELYCMSCWHDILFLGRDVGKILRHFALKGQEQRFKITAPEFGSRNWVDGLKTAGTTRWKKSGPHVKSSSRHRFLWETIERVHGVKSRIPFVLCCLPLSS